MKNRNNPTNPEAFNREKASNSQAMQQLLQEFNKIDNRKQGSIKLPEAIKLIKSSISKSVRQKNRKEIGSVINTDIKFDDIMARVILNHQNQVTFDQFLAMLYEAQIDLGLHQSPVNQKVLEFLRLLQDYRKKCQDATEYLEAQKAHQKISEIKNKEMRRHKQKLIHQQKGKVSSINNLQQSKILQFNSAWNQYMQKYEDAAINSIQKLKAKHLREMEEEQERIRTYYEHYIKPSKKIIDLRSKEKSLVKQRQYQQAQKVKDHANKLFSKQRETKTQQINERIQKRKETLKKHQEIALLAHLKRIEKDRNEQLKQRQNDSQKMLVKLKNIQNDIVQKQSIQIKQTLDNLRGTMCLTSSQLLGAKGKIRSLQKLQRSPPDVLNQSEHPIDVERISKEKATFKIRVNSMHRVKMDHSLYNP